MSSALAKDNGAVPGAQALLKGLAVLDAIGDADRPLRFTELALRTGLPKGTLHRILQALIERRLIRLDARTNTYWLGHRLFELAHKVWAAFDLRGAAAPELDSLADETSETVSLGEFDSGAVLYIDERSSVHTIGLRLGVGRRAPLHCTALGKALLAFLPPAAQRRQLDEIELEGFTPYTITEAARLAQDLALTRARGYATSEGEHVEGVHAVAAPILDHKGEPLASIGVLGPSHRLAGDRLHTMGRRLMEAARRISGNVGATSVSMSTAPRPVRQVQESSVACVLPGTAYLGEGPVWSPAEQCLYWVDILAPAVHRFDPSTGGNQSRGLPRLIGAVVLRRGGGLVALTQDGLESLDFKQGSLQPIVDPEAGITDTRFNDARCDARGRLWAGTMALDASPGRGGIYRFLQDGSWARLANGFTVSNGLDWSPDDRIMYFADSAAQTIFAFDFNLETGEITNRRPFIKTTPDEGRPDGLTVDAEGCLWCAMWDGWAIRRYSPEGALLQTIELPVPRPSSCVFGGLDLRTLYITSGRIRLSEELLAQAPLSGSLFALQTDVKGRPPNFY